MLDYAYVVSQKVEYTNFKECWIQIEFTHYPTTKREAVLPQVLL